MDHIESNEPLELLTVVELRDIVTIGLIFDLDIVITGSTFDRDIVACSSTFDRGWYFDIAGVDLAIDSDSSKPIKLFSTLDGTAGKAILNLSTSKTRVATKLIP